MNVRDVLVRQADSVEMPSFDPDAVVERGEQLVRRRRAVTLSAIVAALVAIAGTTAVLAPDPGRPEPTGPVGVPEWTPGTRPLAYGQGQTLHLGELEVDTGLDFLAVDLTDEGAALVTGDGGIWFTDGTTVERIGTTLGLRRHPGEPGQWVLSDSAGPLLAWLEFRDQVRHEPELVVHDTSTGGELVRQPVPTVGGNSADVVGVAGLDVFVAEEPSGLPGQVPLRRYDLQMGELLPATGRELSSAVRSTPRALAIGPVGDGLVLAAPNPRIGGPPITETVDVVGSEVESLHDPDTGEPVELTVVDGDGVEDLWFTQWVDDDSFVVSTYPGIPMGDLLVCRISLERCDRAVDSSEWEVDALLPGVGGLGAEYAIRDARERRGTRR